ncbi:MAG: hypothetical protein Q4D77_06265 [Peptostreptococcaceae bacterium]|nr:hypothetical protein [Peptostreptococcaceae bacterium]
MKKTKQILAMGIAFILLSMNTSQTFADHSQQNFFRGGVISPFWNDSGDVEAILIFKGRTIYCEADIRGSSKTTRIEAEIILEKNEGGSYREIRSWSASSSSRKLNITKNTSAKSGSYRLRVIAKIYEGSSYYTILDSTTASY